MEDEGGKDWEIQEYSPSGGDMKVIRRLIRRGLWIGKTIVVTGVVISSAPFVLPPLMVVSAVGLACSVPFGVFVASYACAEKLMSKLLPMPKPPPPLPLMLEYKGFSQADEVSYIDLGSEEEIYEEEEDNLMVETEANLDLRIPLQMSENVRDEEGMYMDEEEEKFRGDTKATVKMRVALPVGEVNETVSEGNYYQGKELMEEQMVEQGYEEDDENLAQEETQSMNISSNETHPLVEILRQERPIDNVRDEDLNLAQTTHEVIRCTVIEVEGPYGVTVGAVEQTTDRKEAGDADQGEQSMKEATDVKRSSEDNKPTGDTKENNNGSPFTAKHRAIEVNDARNTGFEGRTEMSAVLETANNSPAEQTGKTPQYQLKDVKEKKSEQNVNITPAVLQSVGEMYGLQEEKLDSQKVAADANGTTKRRTKTKKKKAKSGETSKEEPALNFHPEELGNETASNTDARHTTDKNRLNLLDDKVATVDEVNPSIDAAGIVHPTESGTASRNSSGRRSFKASPNKALFSEEKIWEHIEALRTIVGYKVARHETCMEELKALYIFTGVEPPVSFSGSPDLRDSSDLVEVIDKLRFLMAIVGVK